MIPFIIAGVILLVFGAVAFFLGAIALYSILTNPVSLGMTIAGLVGAYYIHTKYGKNKK